MRSAVLVVLALPLVAGGCHRGGASGGGDLAVGDAPDLALGDAPDFALGDAPDLGAHDPGDMIAAAMPDLAPPALRIYDGVTSDGWAAVIDGADTAWAIKVADGTKTRIADHASFGFAFDDVIFIERDVGGSGVGKLELWHGDGPAVHLTDTAADIFGAAEPISDGAGHVAYFVAVAPGFSELVLDSVDHSKSRVLDYSVQDVELPGPCTPTIRFVGGRLLMQHCGYPATTRTVLSSYDVAGSADVDLATDARDFAAVTGVGVLIASTTDVLTLKALDGSGTATTLASNVRNVRLTRDGSAGLLVTKPGGLERIALSADHTITTLQADGSVRNLYHVSNDGNFVTYSHASDAQTSLRDLWMSDTRTAGTTQVALDANTDTLSFGYDFSDDSKFAVYFAGLDADTWIGSLRARPVGGGAEQTLATASNVFYPAGQSRIVYAENVGGTYPDTYADILFVDLAGSAAPVKMATKAYSNFDVIDGGATLVYLQPGEALHAVKLP